MSLESEILAALKTEFDEKVYKKLIRQVHPDVDPTLIELFHKLNAWKDAKDKFIEIKAGKGYRIRTPKWVGHLSNIYECGTYLKISKHPKANHLIKNEFEVLKKLQELPPQCRHYFFKPVEFMELKDKVQLSSFSYECPELISLKTVMEHRPNGLSDAEFGWIFKRILAGVDFLHMAGYTHTNITADHILINPENHGAVICGLAGATKDVSKMKLTEQPFISVALDVWQIGKLGKTLTRNPKFNGFLNSLTLAEKFLPNNLVEIAQSFEELLPPRKFVPFVL